MSDVASLVKKVFTETFFGGIRGKTVETGDEALGPALRKVSLDLLRASIAKLGKKRAITSTDMHRSGVVYLDPGPLPAKLLDPNAPSDDELSDVQLWLGRGSQGRMAEAAQWELDRFELFGDVAMTQTDGGFVPKDIPEALETHGHTSPVCS